MIPAPYVLSATHLETIRRIKSNRPTFGAWIYLKDAAITEMVAEPGYDWSREAVEGGARIEGLDIGTQ